MLYQAALYHEQSILIILQQVQQVQQVQQLCQLRQLRQIQKKYLLHHITREPYSSCTQSRSATLKVLKSTLNKVEVELAHDPDITIWAAMQENPRSIFYCFLITIGPQIYVFDNIIVGLVPAMPSFQFLLLLSLLFHPSD
jgi:hypothetical protein